MALLISCSGSGDGGGTDEQTPAETGAEGGETGGPAADITFRTLDGGEKSLADYSGKILFVNYMASWSADSKKLVPIMNDIQRKFRAHVTVIGVMTDDGGVGPARSFMGQNDIRFEVLLPGGDAGRIGTIAKLPTTIVFKRDGSIFYRFLGLQRYKAYEDFIYGMYRRRM